MSWETLHRHWLALAALPIAGIAAALVYLQVATYEWQSQGTILVGKVGNEPIEPPVEVLSRLRLQSFKSKVLEKLGVDDDSVVDLLRDELQAREVPGSGLVEIRARGFSPEAARTSLQTTAELLIAEHATRAAPLLAHIEKRVLEVDAELDAARRERDQQAESLKALVQIRANPLLASGAVAQLISLRDAEIRNLVQRKYALEDLLKPSSTFPTHLIEAVYVTTHPAYPRRGVTLLVGVAAGLALGLILAVWLEHRPSRRSGIPRRAP